MQSEYRSSGLAEARLSLWHFVNQTPPLTVQIYSGWIVILWLFNALPVLSDEITSANQQVLSKQLRTYLTVPVKGDIQASVDISKLVSFYKNRAYSPAWIDMQGPLPRAAILRQKLNQAELDGLKFEDYHPERITSLWKKHTPWTLVQLEMLLTDAFFRYSEHIYAGYQEPHQGEYYRDIPGNEIDSVRLLQSLLKEDDFQLSLDSLIPQHEGYLRLRQALQTYKAIANKGGWPELPDGPALRIGQWHQYVPILRQRLLIEGDLELGPVKHPRYFDEAVKFAVERFQVRYGLKMDGVVGPHTRAAMNKSVAARIKQIKLNMERWRWLPRELGKRYVLVNTAGYELAAVNNSEIQFTMGVVIGKPKRPTPIVEGVLHTVILNPYWTVPQTIIFEDLLPKQIRNKHYLASKGIRVFYNRTNGEELDPASIDWEKIDHEHFPYLLRQDPGSKNPLGRIKFLFSNDYDVYLHDTPEQNLFDKDNRAYSSGCIRVERPMQLASYLLDGNNGWNETNIKEAIEAGEYQKISVKAKVFIYLVYMTTWVGENNGVHFRPDVYQWDPATSDCDAIR